MSTEIFLRLDGLEGASRNYAHKGWIELRSWQWGLQRIRKAAPDGKGSREMLNMNRITVTKPLSIDTPLLMDLMLKRTPCAGEISAIPQVAKRQAAPKILGMSFESTVIQSIETGMDTAQEEQVETLVLYFNQVKFEYHLNTKEVIGGAEASSETNYFEWQAER